MIPARTIFSDCTGFPYDYSATNQQCQRCRREHQEEWWPCRRTTLGSLPIKPRDDEFRRNTRADIDVSKPVTEEDYEIWATEFHSRARIQKLLFSYLWAAGGCGEKDAAIEYLVQHDENRRTASRVARIILYDFEYHARRRYSFATRRVGNDICLYHTKPKEDDMRIPLQSRSRAVVLLSGGLGSTVALYWAFVKFGSVDNVTAMTIDYGQVQRRRLDAARRVVELTGVEHVEHGIGQLGDLLESEILTNEPVDELLPQKHRGFSQRYIPGKSMTLITLAAAWGFANRAANIVTGFRLADYPKFPEHRPEFVEQMTTALRTGMDFPDLCIATPLIRKSGVQIMQFALSLQDCWAALRQTESCISDDYPPCGACPTCGRRAAIFETVGMQDPLLERYAEEEEARSRKA